MAIDESYGGNISIARIEQYASSFKIPCVNCVDEYKEWLKDYERKSMKIGLSVSLGVFCLMAIAIGSTVAYSVQN